MTKIHHLLLLLPLYLTPLTATSSPPYGAILGPSCEHSLRTTHDILNPLTTEILTTICDSCPGGLTYGTLQNASIVPFTWTIQNLKSVGLELRESYVPQNLFDLIWNSCIKDQQPGDSLCERGNVERLGGCAFNVTRDVLEGPLVAPLRFVQSRCLRFPAAAARMVPVVRGRVDEYVRECGGEVVKGNRRQGVLGSVERN